MTRNDIPFLLTYTVLLMLSFVTLYGVLMDRGISGEASIVVVLIFFTSLLCTGILGVISALDGALYAVTWKLLLIVVYSVMWGSIAFCDAWFDNEQLGLDLLWAVFISLIMLAGYLGAGAILSIKNRVVSSLLLVALAPFLTGLVLAINSALRIWPL